MIDDDLVEVYLVGGPHNGESVYVFPGSVKYSRQTFRGKAKGAHMYKKQSDTVYTYVGLVEDGHRSLMIVDVDSVLRTDSGKKVVSDFILQGWSVGCVGTGNISELHEWLAQNGFHNLDPVISMPESYDSIAFKKDIVQSFQETGDYSEVVLYDGTRRDVEALTSEFGRGVVVLHG